MRRDKGRDGTKNARGGYLPLALPEVGAGIHGDAIALQSARACLFAHLKAIGAKSIWLPDFICDSLFPAIENLGIVKKHYSLLPDCLPGLQADLQEGEVILLVNYFSLLDDKIRRVVNQYPAKSVIVDNSQALFAEPLPGVATIYSPRKFLGIPDGGFLYTSATIDIPQEIYPGHDHFRHLLLRASGDAEAGYLHYVEAERALEDFVPRRMSPVSARVISSLDLHEISERRGHNFRLYDSVFSTINHLDVEVRSSTPLCYPLALGGIASIEAIWRELQARGLYSPRYWENCRGLDASDMCTLLAEKTLYLPVDQGLTESDVHEIIAQVQEALGATV